MSVEGMKNVRLRSRILKMVLAIVLAFYCCFLPYWTGWIFCVYSSIEVICDDTYLFILIFLIYANSAINPIIYSFFNENFRVAFHVILLKLCRCKRAYQEQVCPPTTSPGENTVPRKLTQSSSNILLEIERKVDCTRVWTQRKNLRKCSSRGKKRSNALACNNNCKVLSKRRWCSSFERNVLSCGNWFYPVRIS